MRNDGNDYNKKTKKTINRKCEDNDGFHEIFATTANLENQNKEQKNNSNNNADSDNAVSSDDYSILVMATLLW